MGQKLDLQSFYNHTISDLELRTERRRLPDGTTQMKAFQQAIDLSEEESMQGCGISMDVYENGMEGVRYAIKIIHPEGYEA